MNVIISDVSILSHIQPQHVEHYLDSHGWHERNRIENRVSIWTRDTFMVDKLKIQVPLDLDFDDYPRRMYEIMETLEKAENRSQLDILSELVTNIPNITIQGMVTQVGSQNTNGKLAGEVFLMGIVVDKLRKIKTELIGQEYLNAQTAYQERSPIRCTGDLIKQDDTFILLNPHNFTLDDGENY